MPIGYTPTRESMKVVPGQDFSHYFRVTEIDPFPSGTLVIMKIFDRVNTQLGAWPAVLVEEGGAQVQIIAADLEPIPDGAAFRVYVTYPDTQTICWYSGRVDKGF